MPFETPSIGDFYHRFRPKTNPVRTMTQAKNRPGFMVSQSHATTNARLITGMANDIRTVRRLHHRRPVPCINTDI